MLFSSYSFIFIFLPIVLVIYFICGKLFKNDMLQKIILIAASFVFYAFFSIKFLILLIISIIVNYFILLLLKRDKKKFYLICGVIFNILFLCYFKYKHFFIESINLIFRTQIFTNYLLPIGISFYVFQQLVYIVMVNKGEAELESPINYLLFVTFFPQLVQGPILTANEFFPQVHTLSKRVSFNNISFGIYLFSIGLFKKAVIADSLAIIVNNGYLIDKPSFLICWITALSYTFQLYFDFSGYSDMAVAVAKMFNFDIPYNFLSPYKSESVTVFWRNWHVTLGRSLKHLVYIPLGGNRKGKIRTYINLFMVFLVSGIWHGDDLTFILWGGVYGILIVLEKICSKQFDKIPHVIRVIITFLIVNFLWILFRASDFQTALCFYKGMIGLNGISFSLSDFSRLTYDSIVSFPAIIDFGYIFVTLLLCGYIVLRQKNTFELASVFVVSKLNCIITVLLFCLSILTLTRGGVFIYFNF
ncbi:MAG: MBOAT family protein [Treponema sp.]|nr:MBOAT family protein [Treponema sp.]